MVLPTIMTCFSLFVYTQQYCTLPHLIYSDTLCEIIKDGDYIFSLCYVLYRRRILSSVLSSVSTHRFIVCINTPISTNGLFVFPIFMFPERFIRLLISDVCIHFIYFSSLLFFLTQLFVCNDKSLLFFYLISLLHTYFYVIYCKYK